MATIPEGPYFTEVGRVLSELIVITSESVDPNVDGVGRLMIGGYPIAIIMDDQPGNRFAFLGAFERILERAEAITGWKLASHTFALVTDLPYSTEPRVDLTFTKA